MERICLAIWLVLLYLLATLIIRFPRIFIRKDNANNRKDPSSGQFPALITPCPVIAFINEEAICAVNEAAIGVIIAPRIPSSCFLFHAFLSQLHYQ